jgi:hypothetical protein
MQRQPVESEAVNSIGYEKTILEVEFHDGRSIGTFRYPKRSIVIS